MAEIPEHPAFEGAYVYQHTNGRFILKSARVVEMGNSSHEVYFKSPFVVDYWYFETRELAETFIKEKVSEPEENKTTQESSKKASKS